MDKIITKNKRQYILVKEYPNFLLYEDMMTKVKECFKKDEIENKKHNRKPCKTKYE